MATKGKGKADLVARAQRLSAGVAKHLVNQTQVVFTGGPFTPAQNVVGITVTPVTASPVAKAPSSPTAGTTNPAAAVAPTPRPAT
jgi:hypothetical protein